MLIAGVALLAIVYWFFFRKKKAESSYKEFPCPKGKTTGTCHIGTFGEPDYREYPCCEASTK